MTPGHWEWDLGDTARPGADGGGGGTDAIVLVGQAPPRAA